MFVLPCSAGAVIPGRPVPLARPRVVNKRAFNSQKKEMEAIQFQMISQYREAPLTGELGCQMTFAFAVPRSRKKKGRIPDDWPYYHAIRPDIDNLIKFYLDCAQGVFFEDDCQIVNIQAKKIYALEQPFLDGYTELQFGSFEPGVRSMSMPILS